MGRKSLKPLGISSFGINAIIKAELQPRDNLDVLQNSWIISKISLLMISHELLINLNLNPTGPGALDPSHEATAWPISSHVNASINYRACIGLKVFKPMS